MSSIHRHPINNQFKLDVYSTSFDTLKEFTFAPHNEIVEPDGTAAITRITLRDPIKTNNAKNQAFTLAQMTQLGLHILYFDAVIADLALQVFSAKQRTSNLVTFNENDYAHFPEIPEGTCAEVQYLALKFFLHVNGQPRNRIITKEEVAEVENFLDHPNEEVRNMAILTRDCHIIGTGTQTIGNLAAQCNSLIMSFHNTLSQVRNVLTAPYSFLLFHFKDETPKGYDLYPLSTNLKVLEKDIPFIRDCYRIKKIASQIFKSEYLDYEKRFFDYYHKLLHPVHKKLLDSPNATLTDEDIDALVDSINGVDINKKKKKKPKKEEGGSSSATPKIPIILSDKEKALLEHFALPNDCKYHPRVNRWFFDPKNGLNRIKDFPEYKDCEDLTYAHAIHAFPEIERLCSHPEFMKKYAKKTSRGFSFNGEMTIDGKVRTGVFQFGTNGSGKIYHRVFDTRTVKQIQEGNLSPVNTLKDTFYEPEENNQTYVKDTKITLEKTGKITFVDDVTRLQCAIMPNPN